jgi:hypothetical protein
MEGTSLSDPEELLPRCLAIPTYHVRIRNSFAPYLFVKLIDGDGHPCPTVPPMVMAFLIGVAFMGVIAAVMLHYLMLISMVFLILLAGLGFSWGERELLVYDVATAINAHPQ